MRVLHAIHDYLPRHRAGSEIHTAALCRALTELGHEIHVLAAEYDPSRPHGSLVWRDYDGIPVTELVNTWAFDSFAETYDSPRLADQLRHVLRALAPDVLHVHNLLNLSFALPEIAADLGIPTVATLHEFALLCPSGGQRVYTAERHVCHEIEPERCARCFAQSPFHQQMAFATVSRRNPFSGLAASTARVLRRRFPRLVAAAGRRLARAAGTPLGPTDIEARLDRANDVFATIDRFVAPSHALADDFVRFGLPRSKIEVADYGFPPMPTVDRRLDDRLRVGFVGTLCWHKGVHVLVDSIRRLPPGRVSLELHGSLDTFPDYVAALRTAAEGLPVSWHGPFDRERVADVFAGLDLLVVPSLWPENSPLVIHEAFQAGVPVVGSRLGGTIDLVEAQPGGASLLYDPFDAHALAAILRDALDEPARLQPARSNPPSVKTIEEDAAAWTARYEAAQGSFGGRTQSP